MIDVGGVSVGVGVGVNVGGCVHEWHWVARCEWTPITDVGVGVDGCGCGVWMAVGDMVMWV